MIVTEFLIFLVAFFVVKYFWDHKRFFYLGYKIPFSSFDYSINGIYQAMKANNKVVFKMINDSFADEKVCSKSWFGMFLFVLITKPEDLKLVLNSKDCLDKPRLVKFLNMPKGSLFGDVEYWHSHRKILNPYFGARKLQNIIPIFNEKVKTLMSNLKNIEDNGEFDVLYLMTALTLETIVKVMEYDVDIQNQKSQVRDVFFKNLEKFSKIAAIRAFKFWLYPDFIFKYTKLYQQQLDVASKTAMRFTINIMENARYQSIKSDNNKNEKSSTFIRALVNSKNNLSFDEIKDEVNTIVLAAQDTSAIASSSTLLLLAMHKNVQQKVFDELHRVFGSSLDAPYIDYDKINELEYLELVINETMRLLPVVPFIFRHNTTEIKVSEGYIVPKGSYITISIFNLHRSKSIWGEDAEVFRPERFKKDSFSKIPSYGYIPFAKGPRMCIGWRYAMMLMKIQLANILLRYEVETSLKLDELEFQYNITMNICQGYKIRLIKREINQCFKILSD